jgi:hypothetical protein
MGLRETLEAATREHDADCPARDFFGDVCACDVGYALNVLRKNAPELAALCLEMGDLLRLPVDEIQEGDAEDVLARLDQIGAADETRLGKEQT